MKYIFSLCISSRSFWLFIAVANCLPIAAQNIAINTTGASANSSSLLEVGTGSAVTGGDDKGVLIPRVALTSSTDATTVSSPATSLLVYNSGSAGLSPSGYYYNQGTPASPLWVQLANTTSGGSSTTGCGDACTWELVGVGNSTTVQSGSWYSSGFTMTAGKEYLVVMITASSTDFTLALTDNPAVYLLDASYSYNANSFSKYNYAGINVALVKGSAGPPLNTYNTLATEVSATYNFSAVRIKGRTTNSNSTDIVQISADAHGCGACYAYVGVNGAGLIYLYDGNTTYDAGIYIFAR